MKRKVIELDTKSSRKERGLGDAPAIGRVGKVSSSERVAEPVYEELDDEHEPAAGDWLIKLGMISALLIGLIVGGAVIYFTAASKLKDGLMAGSDEESLETPIEADVESNTTGIIHQEEALDLVRRGLTVRFASKVNDYFRYTPTLEAPRVIEFLRSLSETDGLVVRMEWLDPVAMQDVMLARVRVHFSSGQETAFRDAYLIQDSRGSESEWRIDFDSFAERREPDLKALMHQAVEGP